MSATFPESRWRRAGAKAREILDLSAEWTELTDAGREEYAKDVASVADSELARRLHVRRTGDTLADIDAGGNPVVPAGGVEPAPETPAAPPAETPAAPDPSTVGADPAGQPGADPTALPEQTADGTVEAMLPVPDGSTTISSDGTGQALPPVPDSAYPDGAQPLDESGLVDGNVPPETPESAGDPAAVLAAEEPASEPPQTPASEPADSGTTTEPTDEDLAPYLASKDAAAAYVAEHPELRERLLVLESEGKARKSVLDVLAASE